MASTIIEYLAYDRIVACGGSWMVPKVVAYFEELTAGPGAIRVTLKKYTA